MFNLLKQKAMFARFRSSPLKKKRFSVVFSRFFVLPGLFELSAKTFNENFTMPIVFDEGEKMRDDLLKRFVRTDVLHRQTRDDVGKNVEKGEATLSQRQFVEEVLRDAGNRRMRMEKTQGDFADVTADLRGRSVVRGQKNILDRRVLL